MIKGISDFIHNFRLDTEVEFGFATDYEAYKYLKVEYQYYTDLHPDFCGYIECNRELACCTDLGLAYLKNHII